MNITDLNEKIRFRLNSQNIKIYSAEDSIYGYSLLTRTIIVSNRKIVVGYSIFGLFEIFRFGIKIFLKEYEDITNKDKFIKSIKENADSLLIKFKAPLSDFYLEIKKNSNNKTQNEAFKYIQRVSSL
jgi:hypothetical protein